MILRKSGIVLRTHRELLITVMVTTVCWLATAYFGPQTDRRTLIEFYKKVQPVRAGLDSRFASRRAFPTRKRRLMPKRKTYRCALLGWLSGSVMIWSALFTVGNFLYGRTGYALGLLVVFAVSAVVLIRVVQRLWR